MQIIDYCVLFSTILVVILIGWLSGRKTRSTDSAKEYLLTEKGINRLQAGFSMAATDLSAQLATATLLVFLAYGGTWRQLRHLSWWVYFWQRSFIAWIAPLFLSILENGMAKG